MKRKVYWLALLASAVMVSQTQAHGFGGGGARFGGASFGGAHFGGGHAAIGHAAPAPSYHGAAVRTFVPNRANYANRYPIYKQSAIANRSVQNHAAYAPLRHSVANLARAHNLPTNWRNHVYARQSAAWHRDWDRSRDHWWHGHHCRFINGSWVIFDSGFDPWWWSWPCPGYYYGYPCDDVYYDY